MTSRSWIWQAPAAAQRPGFASLATVSAALAAWIACAAPHVLVSPMSVEPSAERRDATPAPTPDRPAARAFDYRFGGYGGVSYTHPSVVTIKNPPVTDMTASGFDWIGRPFKSPIYYGARIQMLPAGAGLGGMLDFTHAKAIARADSPANFTGTHNGRPLPSTGQVNDVFRHLEFSHGHNMLTLNGLWRMPALPAGLRPYFGGGAGISLPHTEVGFANEKPRTYEYQFAGFVGQVLAGIEVPLGPVSAFFEYKFTYAPYDVPLSHEPYGWLLVTDLWRQARAWLAGEQPPGGRLDTILASHHAIGGVMFRVGARAN